MVAKSNLSFRLGETWKIVLACNDGSGAPLVDANPNVAFRLDQAGVNLISIDTMSGVWLPSVNPVVADIVITPAMQLAAQIAPGSYDWEGRATLSDGSITDQAAGVLTVEASIF